MRRDGRLVVVYPIFLFRVLLDDGQVVEVEAWRDDSDMRGLVVDHFGKDAKIAGMTRVDHVAWTNGERVDG